MFDFSGNSLALHSYHGYSTSWKRIGSGPIFIGFELEVAQLDTEGTIDGLNDLGIRDSFAMATRDSSIGEAGIELVTQPLGIDYLESEGFKVLEEVLDTFTDNGGKAEDSRYSCGCHHNFSTDKPVENNIMIRTVARHFKMLKAFSGPRREWDFARAVRDVVNPHAWAVGEGRYACVAFRGENRTEFRFPAMTLDIDKFKLQTHLARRLIEIGIEAKANPAYDPAEIQTEELFQLSSDHLELCAKHNIPLLENS